MSNRKKIEMNLCNDIMNYDQNETMIMNFTKHRNNSQVNKILMDQDYNFPMKFLHCAMELSYSLYNKPFLFFASLDSVCNTPHLEARTGQRFYLYLIA